MGEIIVNYGELILALVFAVSVGLLVIACWPDAEVADALETDAEIDLGVR